MAELGFGPQSFCCLNNNCNLSATEADRKQDG